MGKLARAYKAISYHLPPGLRWCSAILALACLALSHVALAQPGSVSDPEALASLDLIKEFQELGRPDSWTSSNIPFTGHLLAGIEEESGDMKLQRVRARSWTQKLFADSRAGGPTGSYSVTTMLLKRPAGSEKDLKTMLREMFGDGPTAFPKRLKEKLKSINASHKAALLDTTTDWNTNAGEIGQVTSLLSLASGQYEYVKFVPESQAMSGTTYAPVMRISSRVEYNTKRGKYIVQHQGPTGGRVELLRYKAMAVAHGPYILIAEVVVVNGADYTPRVTRDERYQHIQAYGPPIHPFPDDLWKQVTDALSPFLPSNANSINSELPDVTPEVRHGEPAGYITAIIGEGKFYRLKNARDTKGTVLKKGDKLHFGDILMTKGVMVKVILDSYEDKPLVFFKDYTRVQLIKRKKQAENGGIFAFLGKLFFKGFGRDHKGSRIITSNAITGCSDSGPGSDNDVGVRRSLPEPADTMFDVDYNPEEKTTRINLYEGKLKIECTQDPTTPIFVTGRKQIVIKDGCDLSMSNLTAQNDTPQKAGWTFVDAPDKPSSEHPGIIHPTADSYVYAYNYLNWNKANLGKYKALRAGWHPTGGESRAYLKFDLSGVNPDNVGKATLRLYHYHNGGHNSLSLGVHPVTSTWQEGNDTYHSGETEKPAAPGEISWVSQPSFDPYPAVQFNPGPGVNKWVEVDVTPLVKAWISGSPNYGLMIKPEGLLSDGTPESQYSFYSREFEDPEKRPVLVLLSSGSPGEPVKDPGKDIPPEDPGGKVSTTGAEIEISKSFTIPPRSGSYAWEHTKQLTIPGSGAVVFEAKARNDIHVSFAQTASDKSPLYEVVIGGWNNTQTVIRKGRQTPQQGHARVNAKQNPLAVASANQWAAYWVSVDRGLVKVGRGEIPGQNITLTWQDPVPLQNLRVLGFSTWNTPVDYRNIRLVPAAERR